MSSQLTVRRAFLAGIAAIFASPALPAAAQLLPRRRLRLIPKEAHPWARFKTGAWRVVQTETLVFDKEGKVVERTRSESTTDYVRSDENNCHLKVVTSTEIPGSEAIATPREVSLPIDPAGEGEVTNLEPQVVTVSGRAHRVEVRQAKIVEKLGEKLGEKWMTVHLASEVDPPRILKRETKVLDPEKSTPKSVTRTEVVKLEVPRLVAGENRLTWEVHTVHEHPAGKVETTEYHCDEVPGEVVYQDSQEYDAAGKLTRRSTVELVAFGEDNGARGRWFIRRGRERRNL